MKYSQKVTKPVDNDSYNNSYIENTKNSLNSDLIPRSNSIDQTKCDAREDSSNYSLNHHYKTSGECSGHSYKEVNVHDLCSDNSECTMSGPILRGYWEEWRTYNPNEPTCFPGYTEPEPNSNLGRERMANTELMRGNLQNVNSVVFSFLEVKQDQDEILGTYTTNQRDLGKVMFYDPWSDFAKPENFRWTETPHLDYPEIGWMNSHRDYFPEKSVPNKFVPEKPVIHGLIFDPTSGNFPYDWLNFGGFAAFAKSAATEKIIGIGGYGDHFLPGWQAAVAHPQNFAKSIIEISKHFDMNGVDLDWEPLSHITNSQDLIDLAKAIKGEANSANMPNFKVSFPITVDKEQIETFDHYGNNAGKSGAWAELMKYVDHVCVMGYDMHGAFDANHKTGLQSTLYPVPGDESGFSTDGAVKLLQEYHVPSDHIILGYPSYARGVTGVAKSCLNERFTGPDAEANLDPIAGISSYRHITNIVDNDDITNVTINIDGEEKVTGAFAHYYDQYGHGIFASFDTPESVAAKTEYAIDNGLAGVMVWSLESDGAGCNSLTKAAKDTYEAHGITIGSCVEGNAADAYHAEYVM